MSCCMQIIDIQKHLKAIEDVEEQERILSEYTKYRAVEHKYEKMIPFEAIVKVGVLV